MRLNNRLLAWLSGFRQKVPTLPASRPPHTHVVLLDGTDSTLARGNETNIGLTYRLLSELPPEARTCLYYEPGIQWRGLLHAHEVIAGIGINRQIRRAYLFLAQTYQPGDRIVLMGFSRGAYAVRSLAGLIDTMGLLRRAQITEDTMLRLYELYRTDPTSPRAKSMRETLCHPDTQIAFLGAFDTVRALGVRWPVIWRFTGMPHPYHNHHLGPTTRIGRHALAINETRDAFAPVLWDMPEATHCAPGDGPPCDVVQMWFRGTHGDVGGQLNGRNWARGLSNIPLMWMLSEAEAAGLPLPPHWRHRYLTDPNARSIGRYAGWGKLFWARSRRKIGQDPSEAIHPTATEAAAKLTKATATPAAT